MQTNVTTVALAGNPNVGKSTIFNNLTGMHQHTGNWAGKTVAGAEGQYDYRGHTVRLIDLPGTYSLLAHSAEEQIARDYICFEQPDRVVVVCDATSLSRNMSLLLQTLEATDNVIVCINLIDEARRRKIDIDCGLLAERLGVPIILLTARNKRQLTSLMAQIEVGGGRRMKLSYSPAIEAAIAPLIELMQGRCGHLDPRWAALRLLEDDAALNEQILALLDSDIVIDTELTAAEAVATLAREGIDADRYKDEVVSAIITEGERLLDGVVQAADGADSRDRKIDRILLGKYTALPFMLLLLATVFFITIYGANYPSELLSSALFWVEERLYEMWAGSPLPLWLGDMLVHGVWRVLAWVVSVMLPPMAIFFPLFTLLEDLGYLPRVAFNLDHCFKRSGACGKQALTMCMGFGCNAVGVTGCRIIDSPRERLIAIITNSLVPCNGRFPMMLAIITIFFAGVSTGVGGSLLSALILSAVILLGIGLTLLLSNVLSHTLLRGQPSSFTIELPPYRRPQIVKTIVRSVFDRTLFVLGRAVCVAAPTGLVIWLLANVSVGDMTLLQHCAAALDPIGRALGMDGVILLAFILGLPANEIVVPIMIMTYIASGTIVDMQNLSELQGLLLANGWTWQTAVSVLIFSLAHWPCATTLMTIRKETGSTKWTLVSVLAPLVMGAALCLLLNLAVALFS